MNTSEKGRRYEWAYRRYLEKGERVRLIFRSAASKGPFDLIFWAKDCFQPIGVQLKNSKTFGCTAAAHLVDRLAVDWPEIVPYVVHRTKETEFCEH
jgi:hypothetical protein